MGDGYHRKKRPEDVRAKLLAAAEHIALSQGLSAVTMQAVADAAGVTKGGLIHHFPNMSALMQGLFDAYTARLETRIDMLMAADSTAYGRFTRAYIRATLDPAITNASDLSGDIILAFAGDPHLRALWYAWIARQETAHQTHDSSPELRLARCAADGLWFSIADSWDATSPPDLLKDLLKLARDTPH